MQEVFFVCKKQFVEPFADDNDLFYALRCSGQRVDGSAPYNCIFGQTTVTVKPEAANSTGGNCPHVTLISQESLCGLVDCLPACLLLLLQLHSQCKFASLFNKSRIVFIGLSVFEALVLGSVSVSVSGLSTTAFCANISSA